jgi:hypothetical protein
VAETIVCPVCGEANAADMEFCRNCQSRLRPLTGPLREENDPIQPGEIPTRKVTSELEPLLPQWLRNARQQARDVAAEDAASHPEPEAGESPASSADLLAGLASQSSNDDEDVPDWVASITGAPAKKKKPSFGEGQVKWIELGHDEELSPDPQHEEGETRPSAGPIPSKDSDKDELTDWFKQAASESHAADFHLPVAPPDAVPTTEPGREAEFLVDPQPGSDSEDLGWLRNLDAATAAQGDGPQVPAPAVPGETPDWLAKLQGGQTPSDALEPATETRSPSSAEVPDWLRTFGEESPATAPAEPTNLEKAETEKALPDWLSSSGPAPEEPLGVTAQRVVEPAPAQSELPDWILSLRRNDKDSQEDTRPAPSVFQPQEPASEVPSTGAAFTDDAILPPDVDAIFASMKTPDWLSAVMPSQPATEDNIPPAAQHDEAIGPAELPSWVQAMRPVESAMGSAPGTTEDASAEQRGPLAGLHGVLPAIPGGAAPSSKPKAHSIKLDATEQQVAHAALLEQILAAETAPVPMRRGVALQSQRALRWAIAFILFIALGGVVFTGTQIFPLPVSVPNETIGAVQAIEAIPADAPVLVVFDYQPSTVGEMEATSAPLLHHLLLLKHPKLALLSTSPTGSALAERFMTTALADRSYVRNIQYVDLGYLPGGLAGVYAFAQNPMGALPLGADSTTPWRSAVLSPVQRLSDFAAIIVLTDSLEAGRTWIEQSAGARGNSLLVVAASAQAGPMLLPYMDSGQISGLVSGLSGASGAEQANGGLPGYVRRYWDGYSVGLYLAVTMIILGGLWNSWLGIQDRRAQAVG